MEFNRLSVALVLRGGKRAGTRARFKSSGMRDVDRSKVGCSEWVWYRYERMRANMKGIKVKYGREEGKIDEGLWKGMIIRMKGEV